MKKLLLGLGMVTALSACGEPSPKPIPIFIVGDIVKMALGGRVGMVIYTNCNRRDLTCSYDVRFPAIAITTNVALLGADGPISVGPMIRVNWLNEFELRAAL